MNRPWMKTNAGRALNLRAEQQTRLRIAATSPAGARPARVGQIGPEYKSKTLLQVLHFLNDSTSAGDLKSSRPSLERGRVARLSRTRIGAVACSATTARRRLSVGLEAEEDACYETQRPGIRASGDCPIALMTGSQPSSSSGRATGGALISNGPFTALRLLAEMSGILSPLSARLIAGAAASSEGATVLAETSSPTRKDAAAKTTPQQPTRNRE